MQLTTRGVHSKHPQKVTKFCKRVVTKCNQHQLAERIGHLQTLETLDEAVMRELETIDTLLTTILIEADKKCSPPQMDPWSPDLNQAYLRHRLWSIALSAKRNQRDMTEVLNSIRARLIPTPEDAEDENRSFTANLRRAHKHLRQVKREAALLRKQHLDSILNEARAANQRKKSSALTYLIRAEQNRRCFAEFRNSTKPKSSGGLAFITTTSVNGQQPTTIIDSEDMNDALLEYSRNHFATAQGTPFTAEPLSRLLQYDGLTKFGRLVSQGRANLEDLPLDEATQALLNHLKSKQPHQESVHPLLYEELQNGIKKWPEKTTTSPSGRHLGIYKSLQRHVLTKDELEKLPPEEAARPLKQGNDVLFLVFDIMSLALKHTYTLERWKTVWTMFIEKELGNPDLNRLRCIMIFEADWQLLLKWHSAYGFLPKSEQRSTLTPLQGGGRKGRSAIDQATQQIVETELVQLTQRPAIDFFLDLRHCFDYMVEACHNLACQ